MWKIDAEDALKELEQRLQDMGVPDRVAEQITKTCAKFVIDWVPDGPPEESVWDEQFQVFTCDVHGTPVVVEYVRAKRFNPPGARVTRFRWNP